MAADKVIRLEDILIKNTNDTLDKEKKPKKKKTEKQDIPRGVPKSGRVWKSEKTRFKSIIKTRGIRRSHSLDKLLKLKEDLKRAKMLTNANKEARNKAIEMKKERRRQKLKKQEENRLKSEIVQVIKNTSKIKRMRKKQLRHIEKRDVTKVNK